jgi:predicted Zn-dependent protease
LLTSCALVFAVVGGTGCATNPATGKRQISLISEQGEIQLGQESHEEVMQAFGDYPDDELEAYIRGVGENLASESERPQLPWSFEVLDDAAVNAMALPGGYLYVTRGILAHMNSEAELAGVLGHEIGHVTARHSVNQLSKQQLYGGLLAVGMIASPELAAFGDLAGQGLGLLFLKFGRDAERQADDLGLRYMTRGGYDPRAMPGMFDMLEAVSALSEGGRAPAWMSTHPNPEARERRAEAAVEALPEDQLGGRVGTSEFLERVDGIVFGADPRQGYFLENRFLHPELRFGLDFPSDWNTINTRSRVVAVGPQENMVIELRVADADSAAAAAREFLSQDGVTAGKSWEKKVNGLRAAGGRFEATSGTTELRGSVAFIEYGDLIYSLLGYGLAEPFAKQVNSVERSMRSFHAVNDPDVAAVQPDHLELVRLPKAMTLAEFDAAYPSVVEIEILAALNRVAVDERMPAGTLVKRITGKRPWPDEN